MKIIVLGALALDHYVIVESFPEEDSMVFADNQFYSAGGSGANIAVNLSVSGNEVCFYCGIGDDENGARLKNGLMTNNVNVHADVQKGGSAETLVVVDRQGKRRIISFGGNALYNSVPENYPEADCVCLVDSFPEKALMFTDKYKSAVKAYVPGGCGLYFGVESIKHVAGKVDITILSEPEALAIGKDYSLISPIVIVTKGSKSTSWFCNEKENIVPVKPVEGKIIDTTGAGDAFASGFICEYLKSREMGKAVISGHETASKIITRYGANLGKYK